MFNDTADQGVKGVLTAVDNVNDTLIEIQSKVFSPDGFSNYTVDSY